MQKVDLLNSVEKLILPIVEKNGVEFVDVEYLKEGPNWVLRVFIDKADGVNLDDCQAVSQELDSELDRVDIIKGAYLLEVSSPGERPLKRDRDFERYKGQNVEVKVYEAINGKKQFEGKLAGLKGELICIMDETGKELQFEKARVALVKRVIKI